jgi:catechol 2,3-dioxygenase-like lactoylglutathione lyase family enzyme
MRTQVTFDVADPHAQAAFWAQVLGLEVEDHGEFVDQLVAEGRIPAADRIAIDGRSAFRDVAACRDPNGVEPRLFFQLVPEPKTAKNRVHLDLRAAVGLAGEARADALEAECARLVALGARRVERLEADGIDEVCIVMQDPEGNEFCLD